MCDLSRDERREMHTLAQTLYEAHGNAGTTVHERITAAKSNGDLDTLRTYERLLPEDGINTIRIDLVISFFRRIGTLEVSSFLTAEQVVTLVTVGLAISEATDFEHAHLQASDHDSLMLEALDHLDRADDMVQLITERHILDPESLRTMLKQMDEHHPVLTVGVL